VSAGGSAAGAAISGGDAAAKLSRPGMVTFVTGSTGTVISVPWQKGMTLGGAGGSAGVPVAQSSVTILRAGRSVYAAAHNVDVTVPVAAGDVVRLGK